MTGMTKKVISADRNPVTRGDRRRDEESLTLKTSYIPFRHPLGLPNDQIYPSASVFFEEFSCSSDNVTAVDGS